jgi:RimJ/RimL family protein N-acetyltransferase
MELIGITQDGFPARPIGALPDIANGVMQAASEMYKATGYRPPWIGYLAIDNDECVGTCAFKTPPADGRVEIAYFTFPDHEGRGVATDMARQLVEKALAESQAVRICAQTLPQHTASTRVLQKLGFRQIGEFDHPEDGKVWEWEWKAKTAAADHALQRA